MIQKILLLPLFVVIPMISFGQDVEVRKDSTQDVKLGDVTIEAAKVIHHNGFDTYIPSQEQRSHSANGLDLLSKMYMPGVYVDQVQRQIQNSAGNGRIIVKINNVEIPIDQLQSVMPSQVVNIEYSNTPGMKYGKDAGTVINIRTRRDDDGIAAGISAMNALLDNYNDDGVWTKFWKNNSEFGLQYNFKLNNVNKAYVESRETFLFTDGSQKRYEGIGAFSGETYKGNSITLSYNYAKPNKRIIDIKGAFNSDYFPNRELVQQIKGEHEVYSLQTHTHSKENAYTLKAHYEEHFSKADVLEMNCGFAYLDNAYNRGFSSPTRVNTYKVEGDKYALSANIDYSHVFSPKSKLSVGYQQRYSYTGNKYLGTENLLTHWNDDNEYLYAEYNLSVSRLYLSVGMGEERVHQNQKGIAYTFYSFLPQLLIQYNISNKWKVTYRYNRKSASPSLTELTEYVRQDDMYQATVGNSKLKPFNTDAHLFVANWNHKRTSFRLYGLCEYSHKAIGTTIEERDGLFMHKSFNNLNQKHFETAAFFSQSLFNRVLSFYVEPKWVYEYSGGIYDKKHSNLSLQAGINAYYRNWNVSFYYRSASKSLYGYFLVKNHATSDINIGYRHQALQIKLGLRNAFSKKGTSSTTENLSEAIKSTTLQGNRIFGNMLYLSLSWNIFRGKVTERPQVGDISINTDSGIVK